ncbi:RAMP superfamily CRISPR-associated protein [Terrisporobacter mayombei]|uniref:CRISPR type III-associated protein domain-containing protein n=1 Tax=Terrisporobacter mayombei TaxID=1541 RepID=A0ABY9PZ83_9FIRM|nr:RAMP superfamily CRISPR-associated protein [Terrisporobacter mayombei]MCC3867931.1 hypothetical protein [Terrisporobacter mayombei]WMT80065.1 hypothetical protein TEMA_03420 [Terrisporobacter mayombei]
MEKYTLKIELLSDTIFSGGESIISVSDIDVLYDDYKMPFYKGKSIKGNIREVMDIILENQKLYDEEKSKFNEEIAIKLFGKIFNNKGKESYRDDQSQGCLKFENASINKDTKEVLKYLVDLGSIKKDEIIDALTDIRYSTKIDKDSGTSADGSLRSMRVLNKDICFYSEIYSEEELSENELGLLLCGVNGLRHLGTLRSRGKGEVKCTLLINNKELSKEALNKIVEKVIG